MFFLMSFRFDKTKPEDFGLMNTEHENLFINPKDNSRWEKRYLIDFGWGLEIAFCKLPLLSFDKLLELSFYTKLKEKTVDYYGAIGVLLNDYPHEFLNFTEKLLVNKEDSLEKHKDFYHIVRMQMRYEDKTIISKWQMLFEQTKELI